MRFAALALLALPALARTLPTLPAAAPHATPAPATDYERLAAVLQLIPTEPAPSPAAPTPSPKSWASPADADAANADAPPPSRSWFGPRGGTARGGGSQRALGAGGPRQLEEQALKDTGYDMLEVFGSYLVLLFVFSR